MVSSSRLSLRGIEEPAEYKMIASSLGLGLARGVGRGRSE